MHPYLRKNLRIVVMRNLEDVSVIRMKSGARLGGTHGLHDGTSAFGGIPRLGGKRQTRSKSVASYASENAPRRCPNPRRLKKKRMEIKFYVDIVGWELYY